MVDAPVRDDRVSFNSLSCRRARSPRQPKTRKEKFATHALKKNMSRTHREHDNINWGVNAQAAGPTQ